MTYSHTLACIIRVPLPHKAGGAPYIDPIWVSGHRHWLWLAKGWPYRQIHQPCPNLCVQQTATEEPIYKSEMGLGSLVPLADYSRLLSLR